MGNHSGRAQTAARATRRGGGKGGGGGNGKAPRQPGPAGPAGPVPTITDANGQMRDALATLFGRAPTDAQIAALAGAPPGARGLVVSGRGSASGALLTLTGPGGLHVFAHVSRDAVTGAREIGLFVRQYPSVPAQARGLAAQVHVAQALGITLIATKSYGLPTPGADWDTLPRLGYDLSVARARHELLVSHDLGTTQAPIPAHLAGARTYYDLWRGDRAWLRSVVQNPDFVFNTRRGSVSVRRLNAYLRAHPARRGGSNA